VNTPTPNPALLPDPPLFDVTRLAEAGVDAVVGRFALEDLELASNARRYIDPDSLDRLAVSLSTTGLLIPLVGHRAEPDGPTVIYDGQRRLLAARRSHELAGTDGYEHLQPVQSLIVLLVDHEPSIDEIRRIQAVCNNARESLSLVDQQAQFEHCWQARAGLAENDRLAAVCSDLAISAKRAHNLRRQLTLPDEIRERVAERPSGNQLSATLANRLADMHEVAPDLTKAVAKRVSSSEQLEQAVRDMGAFVHKSIVEDSRVYAVRIDDGALLDVHEEVKRARSHLDEQGQRQLAGTFGCKLDQVQKELDALAARAKDKALKVRITNEIRDRAATGKYGYVHERGRDFAASIWVVDPVFVIDLCAEQASDASDGSPAREEAYFAGAQLEDDEMRDAAAHERDRVAAERIRQARAERSNLGLGQDIAAGLTDPRSGQLDALRAAVCHMLASHYREVLAYGAGWSDRDRQQPIGDTGRYEPRHIDAIVAAELQRALDEPDPLRGIAQVAARIGAAFMLNPDGITRTKALGRERMARKLSDALPGGENPLRTAIWEFMRPMLSPALIDLNLGAFVIDKAHSSVDLEKHRGDSRLEDLDLGEEDASAA
jgi:ParB-like chromosome segregation protein Spo0J